MGVRWREGIVSKENLYFQLYIRSKFILLVIFKKIHKNLVSHYGMENELLISETRKSRGDVKVKQKKTWNSKKGSKTSKV